MYAIQKQLFGLKNVLQKLTKHFKSFGNGFSELYAKFDADTLFDFAIHRRQNEKKKEVEKALVRKQCKFTAQCHVAE
jgi:hypothetical protein